MQGICTITLNHGLINQNDPHLEKIFMIQLSINQKNENTTLKRKLMRSFEKSKKIVRLWRNSLRNKNKETKRQN